MMDTSQILVGRSYRSITGRNYYVHDITGQKVTYCVIGSSERAESSLRRFAARVEAEIPNQ